MDRVIVYDGELQQATDILNTNKFGMVGQAMQNQAILGSNIQVAGFACTPTGPASLQVVVGPGSIYATDQADATAYGDLGTDSTVIYKQGIRYASGNLTITPPGTSGYSQVYLVQVILSDVDAGSSVLSYYNSAVLTNPLAAPFAGPANNGLPNNTTRTCVATVALKAGVAAPTGSQTTPSPDAGYTGLYAITVANGQATITSSNIAALASAPFFPTLPSVPGAVQGQTWVGFNDTGVANAYVITPQPAITSYVRYQKFVAKIANTNTGASTLNVNGVGVGNIVFPNGASLSGGELVAGGIAEFTYDGSNWELVSIPANNLRPLTQNTVFYVNSSTGSDTTGTGTAANPWQTIQHAYNVVQTTYFSAGVTITFNCVGTFTAGVVCAAPITGAQGAASVVFLFPNAGSSIAATNSSCFTAQNGCQFTVQCSGSGTLALSATGTVQGQGCCFFSASYIVVSGVNGAISCGSCGVSAFQAVYPGATILIQSNLNITASAQACISTANGANIATGNSVTITVTGTPAFSLAFAYASLSSSIVAGTGASFSGSATGTRYSASTNAVINTQGGGASYFPGSVAGTVNLSGGVYGNGTGQYV